MKKSSQMPGDGKKVVGRCLVLAVILIVVSVIFLTKCRMDAFERQAEYYESVLRSWGDWADKKVTFVCGDGCFGIEKCNDGFRLLNLVGLFFALAEIIIDIFFVKKKNRATKIVLVFSVVLFAIGVCLFFVV